MKLMFKPIFTFADMIWLCVSAFLLPDTWWAWALIAAGFFAISAIQVRKGAI